MGDLLHGFFKITLSMGITVPSTHFGLTPMKTICQTVEHETNKGHRHYPPLEVISIAQEMEKWVSLHSHLIFACFFRAKSVATQCYYMKAISVAFLHNVFLS